MTSIVNIAAYKYFSFDDLPERRSSLREKAQKLGLRGTILLSQEGINMFLAGEREAIDTFLHHLRSSHPSLANLTVKESLSDYQPFQRLVVRLKKEIVPIGYDGKLEIAGEGGKQVVAPIENASPKLPPKELKKWLDEGRSVALLDTRNDYETDIGTFEGAIDLRLKTFRDFPEAAASLPDEVKKNPVVMFCTGGIRCEKIGPYMKGLGFENIYQLEGGILKYFEDCEQSHYKGDCFVFDQRVAVGADLAPSNAYECFACRHILTEEETKSDKYVIEKSCPYCYVDPKEGFARRAEAIRSAARRQPGSSPYENRRWVSIPQRFAGLPLIDALDQFMPGFGRDAWLEALSNGNVLSPKNKNLPASAQEIAPEGARYLHIHPGYVEPRVSDAIDLVYEDEAFVVVNKGAPLPVHPSGRFNKNTLLGILSEAYPHENLRPSHRLDASTTGLVVFARAYRFSKRIQDQFASGSVEKIYRVEVDGVVEWETYECGEPISREALPSGGRVIDAEGQQALTRFRVLERRESTTLLEAELVTGRTHQIRLHLAFIGHPVVNDPLYLPGGECRSRPDLDRSKRPIGLHACRIRMKHPVSGETVEWVAEQPPVTVIGS